MGITSTRRSARAARLAKASEERQEYAGAYRLWKKAAAGLAGSDDTMRARCELAHCYVGMAKARVAMSEYRDALDLCDLAASLLRRCLTGSPEVGTSGERRTEQEDFLAASLDAAVCWFYRGTACTALGLEDEARESWQCALRIWLQLGIESEEVAWCCSLLGLAPGTRVRRDDALPSPTLLPEPEPRLLRKAG
jgi:tetratricopeptide (TPR) repeat protein